MSEKTNDETQKAAEQDEAEFWKAVLECPHSARLVAIGNELNKVRMYANENHVNDQFTQAVVYIVLSSYYAGVSPLIRIEQSLNLARGMNNEYSFALAARAYIEVGGRVHKGMRLWGVFDKDRTQVARFLSGAERLLGRYTPDGKEHQSLFKAKGFNVMSFVQSFKNVVPEIEEIYDNLSAYVHGGFEEQRQFRLWSWIAHEKGEKNPIISEYLGHLDKLRQAIFSDFDMLLALTETLRNRYEAAHKDS